MCVFSRERLILSIGLILLLVVPWTTFQNHSHWYQIRWIPFVSPPIKIRDMVANAFLYGPFGYFYARHSFEHRWRAVAYALMLSVATETSQVFSHMRFPSTTDVACNVLGAGGGVLWAVARARGMFGGDAKEIEGSRNRQTSVRVPES